MTEFVIAINGLVKGVVLGKNQSTMRLVENDPSPLGLKEAMVTEMEDETVAFRPDDDRKIVCSNMRCKRVTPGITSPLFRTDTANSANQMCDAVLIHVRKDSGLDVALIDLKGNSPSGFEGQFKATACFVRYIVDLINSLAPGYVEWKVRRWRYVLLQPEAAGLPRKGPVGRLATRATTPNDPYRHRVAQGGNVPMSMLFDLTGVP